MKSILATVLILLFSVTGLAMGGCGPSQRNSDRVDQAHMKVLGILYGKFLSANRGRAPASQDEFIAYLKLKATSWEKIVESAEQLIVSPRDGKRLAILYGKSYSHQNRRDHLWMAYEVEGVDGHHQVLDIRGNIEEMDAQRVKQFFGKVE